MARQSKPPAPAPRKDQRPAMPAGAERMHTETMQRLSKSGKDRGRRHMEKVKGGG